MGGLVRQTEDGGQRAQLAVRHHVPDQAPGEGEGVDAGVGDRITTGRDEGVVQEPQVEPDVVPDHDGSAHELQERGEHGADGRGVDHHGVTDAGEGGDERRDALVRSDQGLVGSQELAAPVAGRRHLGQGRRRRGAAGGLHVEDDEGHLAEGSAQFLERCLYGQRHFGMVSNGCSDSGDQARAALRLSPGWADLPATSRDPG